MSLVALQLRVVLVQVMRSQILSLWIHRTTINSVKAVAAGTGSRTLGRDGKPDSRTRAVPLSKVLPVGEVFDWVSEVSVELTGQMLATVLGIPQADRHLLIRLVECDQ